jgi:hypothetical protein
MYKHLNLKKKTYSSKSLCNEETLTHDHPPRKRESIHKIHPSKVRTRLLERKEKKRAIEKISHK